jgi:arylsulfatase A-like enzyme
LIASDHGESFGEHAGVFCHGTSLYQTELQVPFVIVPPGGAATKQIVKDTVSLRNLGATIVDVLGLESGSPLPGFSLARYWRNTGTNIPSAGQASAPALSEVVPGLAINVDGYGLPMKTWPLGALDDGDWSYIRSEGNGREELYHVKKDVKEQRNLASNPVAQPILDRMRKTLGELTEGPLVPERFNR